MCFKSILNIAWKYRLLGLLVATLCFLVLGGGLMLRKSFVSTTIVQIGGVQTGMLKYEPFEPIGDVERFVNQFVSASTFSVAKYCHAEGVYLDDKPGVKIMCKGDSEVHAQGLTDALAQLIMERHKKKYTLANEIDEQQKKVIVDRINHIETAIKKLREKQDPFGFLEIKSYEYEGQLIELLKTKTEINGVNVYKTQLNLDNNKITNRKPGIRAWTLIVFLSLAAGTMVSVFSGIAKELNECRE